MITLKPGDTSPAVKFLQFGLGALNPNPALYSTAQPASTVPRSTAPAIYPQAEPPLASTGVFDDDTQAAVTRFQTDHTIRGAPLGTVDYLTWWQLAQVLRSRYFSVNNSPTEPQWLTRFCSPFIPPPRGLIAGRFVQAYGELFRAPGKGADGLQKLLTYINADTAVTDIRWAAYMFATVHRECGPSNRFLPVPEDGCDDNNYPVCSPLRDGNQRRYGQPYACPPADVLSSALAPSIGRLEAMIPRPPTQPPYNPGHGPGEVRKWTFTCPAGKDSHTYYGRGYVQLTHLDNYRKMSPVTGLDLEHFPEKALEPDAAYKIMSHGMRKGTFSGARLSQFITGAKSDYFNARTIINGHDAAAEVEDFAKKYEIILYYSLGG